MSESARKLVLGSVAGVVLIVAAFMLLRSSAGPQDLPDEYTIDGVCLNCKESGQFTYSAGEQQPLKCPHCGEQAVFSWFFCNQCKRRFVPNLEERADGTIHLPVVPVCTACGSQSTGAYIADDPTQEPAGDAELPKWPPN